MPIFYRKCAHHWMDKDDPKTQKRSSKRLIGKYKKIGLRSPSLSSPTIGKQECTMLAAHHGLILRTSPRKRSARHFSPSYDLLKRGHG